MCQMGMFNNQRAMERFGLEETWKCHVVQPSCNEHLQLDQSLILPDLQCLSLNLQLQKRSLDNTSIRPLVELGWAISQQCREPLGKMCPFPRGVKKEVWLYVQTYKCWDTGYSLAGVWWPPTLQLLLSWYCQEENPELLRSACLTCSVSPPYIPQYENPFKERQYH